MCLLYCLGTETRHVIRQCTPWCSDASGRLGAATAFFKTRGNSLQLADRALLSAAAAAGLMCVVPVLQPPSSWSGTGRPHCPDGEAGVLAGWDAGNGAFPHASSIEPRLSSTLLLPVGPTTVFHAAYLSFSKQCLHFFL